MEPAIVVILLWSLFAMLHLGLATESARGWFVSRLGELGFNLVYSVIALATFSVVVVYYSQHRFEGAAGLALGTIPALRPILMAVVVLSIALMAGTFAHYNNSPYAVLGDGEFSPPRGLQRITRHPFFAGLVIFSLAHVLLATHLIGAAFAAGLAAVAMVGMAHQDRKLSARYGRPFVRYLESTSSVPFAAIITGRQRIEWREIPALALALGIAIAIALRAVHASIFAHDGLPLIVGIAVSVSVIGAQSFLRKRTPRDDSLAVPPSKAHHAAR